MRVILAVASLSLLASDVAAQRLNPVVELLEAKQPAFGLYAPANRRQRPGAPVDTTVKLKTPDELALDALNNKMADYIFDGSMEGNFDRGYEGFTAFAAGMQKGGALDKSKKRITHPLFVKMTEIGEDHALAAQRIGKQLNLGVSGIVFVDLKSADELKAGIAAMRFKSQGGTRADDVGGAPAYWGMSEKDYKAKADVWPLNPKGELTNFAIVESKEGLARLREIAAVPGIGVLFPGAGTLRGVFSTTDSTGRRIPDPVAWEAAIQQVLAACKEFKVACGYPAGENDIEERMRQGFSVFVIGWGDAGNRAVDKGRAASGRK